MSSLAEKLKIRISGELPGFSAQATLAPEGRLPADKALQLHGKNPRHGSVLALLNPNMKNEYALVFTKRPAYEGVHGGQISFPGGKVEPEDVNPLQAAYRETWEEIGVQPDQYILCGELTSLYIPPSNFMVHPFLAVANSPLTFIPDTREVDYVLEVPLYEILNDGNIRKSSFITPYGKLNNYPCFVFGNQVVWGATAMITAEIKALLNQIL